MYNYAICFSPFHTRVNRGQGNCKYTFDYAASSTPGFKVSFLIEGGIYSFFCRQTFSPVLSLCSWYSVLSIVSPQMTKATVTPDRTISWSYDRLLFGERAADRQCLLRSPEAVANCDRSFMLVVGHRTIGRSVVAWSTTMGEDRTTSGSHKRSIVRSIVRSIASGVVWGVTWTPETSPYFIVSVSIRLVVPPVVRWHDQFWTWPSTLLRLICALRSPTTSTTSSTTSATSRTFFLRLAHYSNIFRSQVGRNLVVSPVWLGFEHDHDLAATDFPLEITHDLCHQSYDRCDQSYVLSAIGPFFGRR